MSGGVKILCSKKELIHLWVGRLQDLQKLYYSAQLPHQRDVYHAKIEILQRCLEDLTNWINTVPVEVPEEDEDPCEEP